MRLVLVFARAYPRHTAVMLLCLVFAGVAEGVGLSTLLPLIGLAANRTAPGAPANPSGFEQTITATLGWFGLEPTLGTLLSLIVFAVVLKAGVLLLANKQIGYSVAHMATDLRIGLLRALLGTRWEYYVHRRIGSFANAVAAEARRASEAYLQATRIVSQMIVAGVAACVAFLVSWQATLAALTAGSLIVSALNRLVRMARRAGRKQTKLANSLLGRLTDVLQAVKPLKAMGRETLIAPLLERETQKLNRALEREVLSKAAMQALQEPLIIAFLATGLFFALSYWSFPIGTVLLLALLCARIVDALGQVQKEFQRMATSESAFWALRGMIDEAVEAREVLSGSVAPKLERAITLNHVSFAYEDRDILHDASLSCPAGKITVIIGPSGAGKTTVADLIIGLIQPHDGEVCIDDVPLREIDASRWRTVIGYVPQETFLLHESVRMNVSLGDPGLDDADVKAALRAAGAWEFAAALPEGLDTVVGERGLRISGGQRQRIALARALVRRPQLLVLDEATTALDPATEAAICQTLEDLRGRITILAICHYGQIVQLADRVYRVVGGGIVPVPVPVSESGQAAAQGSY